MKTYRVLAETAQLDLLHFGSVVEHSNDAGHRDDGGAIGREAIDSGE
ncbi:MAG: hypothetical protein HON65_13705, partial [Rhodospirillales bacterium]|nr:hypothetical protein [Rhodospirillales bacterium]